nr:hypothetical protein [Tanacetum cinerariifolium]
FKVEPHSRNFTKDVVEDISPTTEPQVHNAFPTHPSLQLNMKFQPSSEYLFTYVVWIFLLFLVYLVAPHYLLSLRNEDTIFDLGICNFHFSRPDVSHLCGTVKKFNTHPLNDNPTPSSDCKTKSSSTSLNSLLEETNTFDNSLPEFETFFDVKEIGSGNTTTPPDITLPEYEAFNDDHVKEISSGKYDCFLFKVEPNSRDFTKDVVEDISPTKEPQVLRTLPTHPTLQLNMKFQPSSESLFTYVVWIFLPFLVYLVAPHYLLSLRNEDTIFDPGICNFHFSRLDVSHRCGTVKKFNTHRSHLKKCPMIIHG